MINQLHTQYIPKRAPSVLYILYLIGTLLMLYYIDPKKTYPCLSDHTDVSSVYPGRIGKLFFSKIKFNLRILS